MITQLVKVSFSRQAPKVDQAWLDRRYEFFGRHTLRSLRLQTRKDWRLWFACDPGMRDLVAGLKALAPDAVFTFGDGAPGAEDLGAEGWQRLQASDHVYVTRIDSDDLYARDALALAASVAPEKSGRAEASVFCRGYLYELATGRLATYRNNSGPFHTVMFPRADFADPARYAAVWHRVGDHSMVARNLRCHRLPDYKFAVLIHQDNFLSTFDYGRERGQPSDPNWSVDKFLAQPVVFDVDDLSDRWDCLRELDALKAAYPGFRCTAFAIPGRCGPRLLERCRRRRDWLELAVHGITHEPNEELRRVPPAELYRRLSVLNYDSVYARGFRPPGWYLEEGHAEACARLGLWVALHARDAALLSPACTAGYYACGDRWDYHHAHSHKSCGNGIQDDLASLLVRWPKDQAFAWVSESILVRRPEW